MRKEGGVAPPPQQAISNCQLEFSDLALPGAGGACGSLSVGPPVPSLSRTGDPHPLWPACQSEPLE